MMTCRVGPSRRITDRIWIKEVELIATSYYSTWYVATLATTVESNSPHLDQLERLGDGGNEKDNAMYE
jgi:hypothetical protein